MRFFIAADVDENIRQKLAELQERIKLLGDVKLVEHNNLHMTFRFLGGVDEKAAEEELRTYSTKRAFTAMVRGIGAFRGSRNARVIWAGVYGYEEMLHITLARIRQDPQNFHEFINDNK